MQATRQHDRSRRDDDAQKVVIGPDGRPFPVGALRREGHDEQRDGGERNGASIEEPAKILRLGRMIKQLLEEVRAAPLDEASRNRLRETGTSTPMAGSPARSPPPPSSPARRADRRSVGLFGLEPPALLVQLRGNLDQQVPGDRVVLADEIDALAHPGETVQRACLPTRVRSTQGFCSSSPVTLPAWSSGAERICVVITLLSAVAGWSSRGHAAWSPCRGTVHPTASRPSSRSTVRVEPSGISPRSRARPMRVSTSRCRNRRSGRAP